MSEMKLEKGNQLFIEKMKADDPDYFNNLSQGQSPDYFVLACCDSRVSPPLITNMDPGQMFEHRNVANQVDANDDSFTASLHYALKYLKVKTIIINGHTECGGIDAAWTGNEDTPLQPWLKNIRNSLPVKNEGATYSAKELSTFNVLAQMKRLKEHPVYKEYGQDVEVVGLIFDLHTGRLEKVIPEDGEK